MNKQETVEHITDAGKLLHSDTQETAARREIKFRAWDAVNKWMITTCWDSWLDFEGGYWEPPDRVYDTPNQEIVKIDGAIVMQFIGLTDVNGKEIYEGDIIKTSRKDWGVIVYKAPFFEVTVSATESSSYSREWLQSCEVVGNIYENPELLGGQMNKQETVEHITDASKLLHSDTQETAERSAGVEERALRCLDYRLTGAEAVTALSVMQEFARQELARKHPENVTFHLDSEASERVIKKQSDALKAITSRLLEAEAVIDELKCAPCRGLGTMMQFEDYGASRFKCDYCDGTGIPAAARQYRKKYAADQEGRDAQV